MTTRTLLLSLHIAAIASWFGADVMQHAIRGRWHDQSQEANLAWSRVQFFLHDRYYAVVAVVILASGVGLVFDGDWGWSSTFIWVGLGTIVAGGTLGGIRLKGLATKRITALESGDTAAAEAAEKSAQPVEWLLTALVLVTIVAMVHKWGAA